MKHNDHVKAGNIVYWEDGHKYPEVVLYVKTADWKDDPSTKGVRYARLSDQPGNAFWMPLDKLTVAADTRSTDRTKQYEFLHDFKVEIEKQNLLKYMNNVGYNVSAEHKKILTEQWNKDHPENPIP